MNNSNTYYQYYSESHPGLWILLTDETEESINRVNNLINECILRNFIGESIRNRCYLHIIGYNGEVKRLVSGYLRDYEKSPLEILDVEKIICIDQHIETVRKKTPIWCKKALFQNQKRMEAAISSQETFVEAFIANNPLAPAPVIWNIGSNYIEDTIISDDIVQAIRKIKSIECNDGNVLFVNAYPSISKNLFLSSEINLVRESSYIPETYLYRFRYEANSNFGIDYKSISKHTHLSFNSSVLNMFIEPIMGYLSEPRIDMEIFDK